MTVLPDLERQLVEAAASAASGGREASGIRLRRRASLRRRVPVRRLALALSVVPVLGVAAVILSTRGENHVGTTGSGAPPAVAALRRAAGAAATGTSAPVLKAGQAWHTTAVVSLSMQRTSVEASQTGLRRMTVVEDKWIGADGMEGLHGRTGTRGAGFSGVGSPLSGPGFGEWDPVVPPGGHGRVQAFPSDPAAVPAYLRRLSAGEFQYLERRGPAKDTDHSPFTQLAQLTSLLADWPLRPAGRAVAFEAIAQLPGLRYLGPERDAFDRPGVAVAEDGIGIPAFRLPAGSRERQDFRFTLIFSPQTGRVLAARTTLLSRLPIGGAQPGKPMFGWTYAPGLPQPGDVTRPSAPMQREAARERQFANLRKPGHVCYQMKTRLSGPNANSAAAVACRRAIQRINRVPRPKG